MTGALSLNSVPGLGRLVGSIGSDNLLRSINDEMNAGGFFGGASDFLADSRRQFVETFVQPFREIGNAVRSLVGHMDYDDTIIPIVSEEQLPNIPLCMHFPILQYEPVRKLFEEGRIFGFGYDYVPEDDPYGRLINNGTVPDVLEAMDDEGEFELNYEFLSTDPDLSFDELESIEETRLWLEKYMKESNKDFTDPLLNERG